MGRWSPGRGPVGGAARRTPVRGRRARTRRSRGCGPRTPRDPRARPAGRLAAEAEPEVVARVAEDRGGRDQDALGLEQVLGEAVDGHGDGASPGSRPDPRAAAPRRTWPARRSKKASSRARFPLDDRAGAGEHAVAGPQRDQRQDLRRRRGADRRVVLEPGRAVEEPGIVGREPADAQAGQRERLAHHADADPVRTEIRAGRQAVAPGRAPGSGTPRRTGAWHRHPRRSRRRPGRWRRPGRSPWGCGGR